jgi:hypothetical protein
MFAQASTSISDGPGFGVAEWIGIATVLTLLIGAATGAIVQLVRLRRENTQQHAEGRELVTDVRDRLLDLHTSVNKIDDKVDSRFDAVTDELHRHENIHHRGRRKW